LVHFDDSSTALRTIGALSPVARRPRWGGCSRRTSFIRRPSPISWIYNSRPLVRLPAGVGRQWLLVGPCGRAEGWAEARLEAHSRSITRRRQPL